LQNQPEDIESLFTSKGAKFILSSGDIASRLNKIKALILDWDGVFNDGKKANNEGSPFNEVDSMGLNMLRFSFYLKHGFIPAIFIITGENNLPAIQLSKREHFRAVYIKTKNKMTALDHLTTNFGFANNEMCFVYDDILDLGLAASVSLRFFVNRGANPLLSQYVANHKLAEYYTANSGGENAVREISELAIGLLGNYNEVVIQRVEYSSSYQEYLSARNSIDTEYFTSESDQISKYTFA
jgi:3-deoxy-D-manno-octulosonate 8-phosphate phosphatase (KDO 8-P phosphatase)